MRRSSTAALILAVLVLATSAPSVDAADGSLPEICLTIGRAAPDDVAEDAIVDAVAEALAARPVLIPDPAVLVATARSAAPSDVVHVLVRTDGTVAGPISHEIVEAVCGVARPPGSWSAVISGAFLGAGTKRELAAAPTTPGFTSSIDVEWDEAADRVRTILTFSGPLDIPNGTCWMDDVVAADGQGGTMAETTTGSRTSPFGDGVCGRFEEYLADGGAGAQALVLLPREIELATGMVLRLRVDSVDVRDDAVRLTGTVERGP